ncbi:MAG TPA: hypothetical protein VF859_06245 [Burkholderiales bacterium]
MRMLAFFEYGAVLLGVIAIAAGSFFHAPRAMHIGIFLIGAGIALAGAESVFTREPGFRFRSGAGTAYQGAPAVIWGLMLLLTGSALIAWSYLQSRGLAAGVLAQLARRPAPVLAAGGLLSLGAGAILLFNPGGDRGIWRALLVTVPRSLLGAALALAGIAAVGAGLWEWLDPQAFGRAARALGLPPRLLP